MATFYEAYRTKEYLSKKFLKRKGIVGIGVGYADPKHPNKGAGINVYTDNIGLAAKRRLLKTLTAAISTERTPVPVRLIPTGPAFATAALSTGAIKQAEYMRRVRPVPAGYSVSPTPSFGSGTAGLIVHRGGQLFLASNNHVLSIDNGRTAPPTVQPGQGDGGTLANDHIGRLYAFVPLRRVGNNYVDAAVTLPLTNSLLDPRYGVNRITVDGDLLPRVGARLFSESRTTGRRPGVVESVNTDIRVRYGDPYRDLLGVVQFRNQTIIRGNFAEGDSGVVWLQSTFFGGTRAVAMSFAGFNLGTRAISFPMTWFNQLFGTQVAQPSGQTVKLRRFNVRGNYKYAQPLTQKVLSSIKVVRPASRK